MELAGNGMEADALGHKHLDVVIALVSPVTPLLLELVCPCWRRSGGRRRWAYWREIGILSCGTTGLGLRRRSRRGDGWDEHLRMVRKKANQRLAQILEDMPSVRHLDGLRSTLLRPFSVRTCAIAADKLDSGMLLEPGAQSLSSALRQELNRAVPIKIDQNGAIGLALAEGEIVDTKMLRSGGLLIWDAADSTKKCVPTGWLVELSGDAGTGGTTQSETDGTMMIG